VPAAALVVFKLTVTWVGSVNVTLLTVMPPVAVAPICFANPGPLGSGPGSKNSVPDEEVPVMVTEVEATFEQMLEGTAADGAAGSGALS
jgi:hypothetical protein